MKEFVLLNQANEVVERASLKENLTKLENPNLRLIEFEGEFLVGDKIEEGRVIPIDSPMTERGIVRAILKEREAIRNKVLLKLGITDKEFNELFQ